jgi:hypothetical protein
LHNSAADEATINDRLQSIVPFEQGCSGCYGIPGNHRVELTSPHHVPVLRVHRMRWPLQLELTAHPSRSQSVVLVELAELIAEAHLIELVHCSWSEAVPARLFAWERFAFDDGDIVAVTSEPVCG